MFCAAFFSRKSNLLDFSIKTGTQPSLSWFDQSLVISCHEVHKFLLIFHTFVETINSDQPQEETDSFVTDTILQIVNVMAGLLKKNTDSLNIPAMLKSTLKKVKSFFIPQTIVSEEGKTGDPDTRIC